MAKMIPPQVDESTVSAAERKIFDMLRDDSKTSDWTVLHSLGLVRRQGKPYGEIDFVLLIPKGGVFCLEVKGGRVFCKDGIWHAIDRYEQVFSMKRSPFMQAREGMYAIKDAVLAKMPPNFPGVGAWGYAVITPDVDLGDGVEWAAWQSIGRSDLGQSIAPSINRFVAEQRKLDRVSGSSQDPTVTALSAVKQVLRPDFETVISRSARIEDAEERLLRLTTEQFESLDLLADNERCLFEGAAGTGKTMLALEYARRSAAAGKRTLLVCYNRLLGGWLEKQTPGALGDLVAGAFYRHLKALIGSAPCGEEFERECRGKTGTKIFEELFPFYGRLAVEQLHVSYDVLVVDEAQDLLRPGVLDVLDVLIKGGLSDGRWAIFGDFHRQAIFGTVTGEEIKGLLKSACQSYSKGSLRQNCRNTRHIGDETAYLSGFPTPPYRSGVEDGLPVDRKEYDNSVEQRAALVSVITALLRDGIRPEDIVVLSRLTLANSGIAGTDGGKDFQIVDVVDLVPTRNRIPVVRFSTIHGFKGMESSAVILCDVDEITEKEPQSLLYVGMSRARSHLTVLLNKTTLPAYRECVRRGFMAELGSPK